MLLKALSSLSKSAFRNRLFYRKEMMPSRSLRVIAGPEVALEHHFTFDGDVLDCVLKVGMLQI